MLELFIFLLFLNSFLYMTFLAAFNNKLELFYNTYLSKYFTGQIPTINLVIGVIFRAHFCYLLFLASSFSIFVDLRVIPHYVITLIIIIIDIKLLYHRLISNNDFAYTESTLLLHIAIYPLNILEGFIVLATPNNMVIDDSISTWYSIVVGSTVVLIVLLAVFVKIIFHYLPPTEQAPRKIENIKYQLKTIESIVLDEICPICRDDYIENSTCYLFGCKHYAHAICCENWWNTCGYRKCFYNCSNN